MADWRGRPVSANIQDHRYGVPLLEQIIEGYKYSGAADLFGDSYAAQMARQSTTPIKLTGGPGPYRGDPLISIETVRGRQVKPGMTLEQAKAAPLQAPPPSFDQMYRDSGGAAFKFASTQPKSSAKVADNFANYYTGNMAPPLKLPGGGYAPAPSSYSQMSPEEIYQGIYGEPIATGPTTRKVKTIPVGPSAQDPMQQYAESGYVAKPRFIAATANNNSLPALPNQPAGSIRTGKDQARLASGPSGWDPTYGYAPIPKQQQALAAIDAAAPTGPMFPLQMPGKGTPLKGNYTASMRFASAGAGGDGILDLTSLTGMTDRGAQGIADSEGKPIRAANGKVYYPGGKAPQAAQGRTGAAAAAQQSQQRSGGLGGLLAGLFGGGQTQQAGGGLGAMLSGMNGGAAPQPTYTTTPFQENAFQTTTGAQMPASMNNSRWLTGY